MGDKATIVVQFGVAPGSDAEGHLSAEIDARADGLNGGQTSFSPGQDAYILVHRSTNVALSEFAASVGVLSAQGAIQHLYSDEINFEGSRSATLSVPLSGAGLASVQWIGNNLGALTVQADKMTVEAATSGVAIARVTYMVAADVLKLATPADVNGATTYPVLVLIKGVAQ